MASEADTIKEFLVSLGFKIDPGSERRFVDSIGAATVKAVALGTAVTATAGAVVAGVARIAENLEQLYFASKRTNAAVENLQATGFAAKQMGVDAATALGSVESLARFLRNSPGGEGLLKNLGINTRDARGAMRDTVDLMGDLGKKFADMPYYKAHAFAQALGIDEKTLMAMREGMGEFQQQYKDMLHAAGVDSQSAAKGSHEFMVELRLLGAAFGVLEQKTASSLTGGLTIWIRRLRENFVANFDRIGKTITTVLDLVMRVADAVATLGIRGAQALSWLVDWFRNLTPEAQRIIEIIGGILIAWRLLSAGFLATPLGRILALAAALASLWDDYQTWKEGGKSLIDWSAWAPGIEAAIDGLKRIGGGVHEALGFLGDWRPAFEILLAYVAGSWLFGMLGAIGKVGAAQKMVATTAGVGRLGLVGVAAAAGYGIGTVISDNLSSEANDTIGGTIANALASLGFGEAKEALDNQMKAAAGAGAVAYKGKAHAPAPAAAPGPSGTRGVRNNNPGNIEYGPFTRAHGATGREPEGRFARFATAQDGLNALADKLRDYMGHGRDSVKSIMEKYAPPGENDTEKYVAFLAKRIGVDPNAHLDPNNLQQLTGMMDGIVRYENAKNPYAPEMLQRAAARGVGITQETHITVNGANDPQGVAQATASAQNNVNGQLVRNLRGAVVQ